MSAVGDAISGEGTNGKERAAVRAIISRIPVAGQMGGVREMGVDFLAGEKVSDNKLREHNGKYILYRNGRVVVITRDLRIARHAIKNPRLKSGGVGPTNWEETARMEIQNEYYNGISYFGCVVPLIAHS